MAYYYLSRLRNSLLQRVVTCSMYSQLEECIGDLEHQDVGMIVFMADEDAFARSPHAMLLVVLF